MNIIYFGQDSCT